MASATCVLCKEDLQEGDETVKLREKGSIGVNLASSKRGDDIKVQPGDVVHINCRRRYCNPKVLSMVAKTRDIPEEKRTLRSKHQEFIFSEHCLFCGQDVNHENNQQMTEFFTVRTMDFQKSIEQVISKRNDQWAEEVRTRLELVHDLPAADAVYHQPCSVNFRTLKQIPTSLQKENNKSEIRTPGRPTNDNQEQGFQKVIQYLKENDNEQVTIADLVKHMETHSGKDAYTIVHMKRKLLKHFGSSIIITEINGLANVVTFQATASNIINNFYKQPKDLSQEDEKKLIIETAAKLIKSDIKTIDTNKSTYPESSNLSSCEENLSFVPESLRLLLRTIFNEKDSELKIASIGQAVIQATRPRVVLAPLQIGLGVQMHHQFGSKFLIDTLNKLGFSASYSEVQKFELNAALASSETQDSDISGTGEHMIQYIADNVDHNLRTIDGHGTFHGMGIISTFTPRMQRHNVIPRSNVSIQEVTALSRIDIRYHKPRNNPLGSLKYGEIKVGEYVDLSWKTDVLSSVVWPLRSPVVSWSAMMQAVQDSPFPGKSDVIFLPMIDLNPSDMSCIYSTLTFVTKEAKKQGVTPIITFDQPLYWKALTIIQSESTDTSSDIRSIVLRLGAFHMEMSFLGCIGYLMRGSGIVELLETVYAPTAVGHMLNGKAVARAIRGHFLIYTVLTALLMIKVFGIKVSDILENVDEFAGLEDSPSSESDESRTNQNVNIDINQNVMHDAETTSTESAQVPEKDDIDTDLLEAIQIYDQLLNGDISHDDVCDNDAIARIQNKLDIIKTQLLKFRTPALWIQYMNMIEILKRFIKAERMGIWSMHLKAVSDMLPFFAAAGHNLYAKSAYIYLQSMLELGKNHPDVQEAFEAGHHVIRRSDRFWGGLSTDFVIEQVLMRSVKSTGGMTRGRGMSESQRAQWLLSMPACADFNNSMQELTNTQYHTSDQHKEGGTSRKERDHKDMVTFITFLAQRNPFLEDASLRNLETGETAEKAVNVDKASEVGTKIINSMAGKQVSSYVFKKNEKVVPMDTKSSVKIGDDVIHVDPQLLFQRLVAAANGIQDDISDIFRFELSTFPSSIFETSGLLRVAQKPALADGIWAMGDCSGTIPNDEDVKFVIDGGWLLHQIPWSKGSPFSEICQKYIDYIVKEFTSATVVFDGYHSGPSTKDETHRRRIGSSIGTKVVFSENTVFKSKKEDFLKNVENKQNFINLLSQKMNETGSCQAINAHDDADVLIVKTAIASAADNFTILIGEDTDLLVLLLYHGKFESKNIIFKTMRTGMKTVKVWDIQKTKSLLKEDKCRMVPFVHAMTGCDTTSRMFGIGKSTIWQKLKKDTHLLKQVDTFLEPDMSQKQIIKAGEIIISSLYGGATGEGLDELRYRKFASKVVQSTVPLQVHTLPPTSAAASFHSMRVYLQTQVWISESQSIDPLNWGWEEKHGHFVPIKTNVSPAPDKLLKVIHCKCKTNCDRKNCSCRKHGLECTFACVECKGVSCSNSKSITGPDIESDM